MRRAISRYQVHRVADGSTSIVLAYQGGGTATITGLAGEEAEHVVDLLRHEGPLLYDDQRRRLLTATPEPVGEDEHEPDLDAWLTAHPTVAAALRWQDAGGARSWPSWPDGRKRELRQAFSAAWVRGQIPLVDPPPNQFQIGDLEALTQVLAESDAWNLFRAYVAHGLATEIGQWVGWSVLGYRASDLELLFDSRQMFPRRSDGGYRITRMLGRAVPAPPRYTIDFLGRNQLIGRTRVETIGKILEWCRDNLHHFAGAPEGLNVENQWQYRGFPPVSRVIEGTRFVGEPDRPVEHRTAGCWGTTGFLRAVLRTVNIPAELLTTSCGHAQPHFPTEGRYLTHGDDPYNAVTKEQPRLTGESLLVDDATYAMWFGPDVPRDQVCENIGRRPGDLRGR